MSGFRTNLPTRPTSLRGSNGIAFGPDGRLHVAQFLAGPVQAPDDSRSTPAGRCTSPMLVGSGSSR
ncbi:hypothetical protein ILP97_57080 [Amycolatopsis sp. H6(2020)]|nr:hypothetical protein [Amycolatopsis sp. H6(2020)]